MQRWIRKFRSFAIQNTYFIGTAVAAGMLLAGFYPPMVAMATMGVIVAHELGHYLVALALSQSPKLPFFIPIGIGVIGATYVDGTDHRSAIAIAGPIAGLIACHIIAGIGFSTNNTALVVVAVALMFWELFSATLGKDGHTYRTAAS